MRVAIVSNGDAFIKRNVNGRIVYHNRQLEPCDEFQAARGSGEADFRKQIGELAFEIESTSRWRIGSVVGELRKGRQKNRKKLT